MYKVLNDTEGVADTISLKITNIKSGLYSSIPLDIDDNLTADGRALSIPEDYILEIKNPEEDIKGTIQ